MVKASGCTPEWSVCSASQRLQVRFRLLLQGLDQATRPHSVFCRSSEHRKCLASQGSYAGEQQHHSLVVALTTFWNSSGNTFLTYVGEMGLHLLHMPECLGIPLIGESYDEAPVDPYHSIHLSQALFLLK
jgi:hypothetical protein